MTEDQIRAIAEEYAKNVYGIADYEFLDVTEKAVFSFLSTRYCIAEREKVKAFYNGDTFGELDFIEIVSTRRVLKSLFGTSMFNQDEE